MTRMICARCGIGVAIAAGHCRKCYDRAEHRRASRLAWRQSQLWWRREGLASDPLEGWEGVAGIKVNSSAGWCALRRPARTEPDVMQVRRPGHPLAGKHGWVSEPRAIAYDLWVAEGRPKMRCVWCRTPLVWQHKVKNRLRSGPTLARPVKLDPNAGWTPLNTAVGCWECASAAVRGFDG